MIPLITTIASAVTTLAANVGPAVRAFAKALATTLPIVKDVVVKVADVFTTVARRFDYLGPNDDVLTTAVKASQEGTRERVEGESMEDYFKYLREEVELDKEILANMTEEEKTEYRIVGTSMVVENIVEKMGVKFTPDFIAFMAKMEMTANQLEGYVKNFSKEGIGSMDDLTKFLVGKLPDSQLVRIYNIVESVEKTIDPDMDDNALNEKIDDMKKVAQSN